MTTPAFALDMDSYTNKPTWIRAGVLVFRTTVFTILILTGSGCASMYQYETPYFIVNSSASKRDTLAVLTDIEMFRGAVMQVANLRVPDSAAKTQILIFRSKEKFASFGRGSNVGGFTQPYDGRFFIVVPSSGSSPWMASVVRHEFSHVLLGHQDFRYPQWYEEGFAQLVSTIWFQKDGTSFFFGEVPDGFDFKSGSKWDWNTIISEGFDTHAMSETEARVAYQQSWLLAHYATLGNDFGNRPKLLKYFELIDGGEPSLAAFERAFGMDGNDLWDHELRPYSKRLSTLRYDLEPDTLQINSKPSRADAAAVQSLVDQLRARTVRLTEKRGLFYEIDSTVPYTGPKISVHPNGQKSRESNIVNGVLEGRMTQWHENGQKAAEGDFVAGNQSGPWISWHENGQKAEESNFVNGELVGRVTQWHANGQKAAEGDFIAGKQSGRWIFWHENGRKEVEVTFLEGEMKSASEWRDENGNVKKPDSAAELNMRAAE